MDCGRKFVLVTTYLQYIPPWPGRRKTWEGNWKIRAGEERSQGAPQL
jgi:hypothetical protein